VGWSPAALRAEAVAPNDGLSHQCERLPVEGVAFTADWFLHHTQAARDSRGPRARSGGNALVNTLGGLFEVAPCIYSLVWLSPFHVASGRETRPGRFARRGKFVRVACIVRSSSH